MADGTYRVSTSRSTTTWKVPVAAWYSCRSWRDSSRGVVLRSTTSCPNGLSGSQSATFRPTGTSTASPAPAATSRREIRRRPRGAGSKDSKETGRDGSSVGMRGLSGQGRGAVLVPYSDRAAAAIPDTAGTAISRRDLHTRPNQVPEGGECADLVQRRQGVSGRDGA